MKPYGIPRDPDAEFPDKADISRFGLKGERRRSKAKRQTRRYWKRKARRDGDNQCDEEE